MRRGSVFFAAALLLVPLTSSLVGGCGGKDARPVGVNDGQTGIVRKPNGPEPPVTGFMFASVSERTIGPLFARRGAGPGAAGLVSWVTVAEGSGRRVLVVPIDARGAPRGGETTVANVSVDTTMLVVKPMRGTAPGFVIAWTSLTDRGKSLWSVAVDDSGMPRAKPVELTRTNDDIVWIDIVPTDLGAICLWAEETRAGDANIVAAPLNTDGKVRGVPARVARGVVGWHALELPSGIGLSTVAAAPIDPKTAAAATTPRLLHESRPGGALSFQRLDAEAHASTPPIAITTKPIVSGDVEVTREATSSRLVFAWTDRSTEEPTVAMAALDDKNVVEAPRKVAEARGGASLLGLVNGGGGTALMFEAPTRRRGEVRRVHVAHVGAALTLDRRSLSLEVVGRGQPELTATSTGFAILATTADCEPDAPTCANAKAVATVHRTDAHVALLQREPLMFQEDPATLGWGMTCDGEVCFALAASPGPQGQPSRIRTAAIHPRATNAGATPNPITLPPSKDGPRIIDITAIASGESVVDMATTRIGETTLVATLSAKADAAAVAEGGKGRRTGAGGPVLGEEAKSAMVTLSTRVVEENGTAAAPSVITTKALAVGGVAIANADKPDDGGAIAWVGRENGDPEVHVTRIDKRGRRTSDVQLTTVKGDANDVTITWATGGWIVAWVDGRDGNGEVYATKVSPELGRIAREERITNAPGDASDLVALARGDAVWLAWADPRESPKDGLADIYVSAVRMRDAKRMFDEQRVLPTAAHSRTPHLALSPAGVGATTSGNSGGVHVAWIEEAPLGAETPSTSGYGAFWARLDPNGKLIDKPLRIPLAGEGAATSVAIEVVGASSSSSSKASSGTDAVHAVVARSTIDAISLDAVDLGAPAAATSAAATPPTTPPAQRASSLLALDGPPSLDVGLMFEAGVLYFNDDGPQKSDRRARRARIAWTAAAKP